MTNSGPDTKFVLTGMEALGVALRIKITDEMITAGMNAMLASVRSQGHAAPDFSDWPAHEVENSRQTVRAVLQAGADVLTGGSQK